jgi:type IV secretory pathway VirB2 component (pilin)
MSIHVLERYALDWKKNPSSRSPSVVLIAPLAAHAQGTPVDTGFQALQNLFTGTVAKVASLIAIVILG